MQKAVASGLVLLTAASLLLLHPHFSDEGMSDVIAANEPRQWPAQGHAWQHGEFTLTALAHFEMTAYVLSTQHYADDAQSKLAPYDIAFGWGPMSEPLLLSQLRISQSNRWYYYEWPLASPISPAEIALHSANMHVIAANDAIARSISALKAGQVVQLRGYLVKAETEDGFSWISSLTRDDEGKGACELVYINQLIMP